jgi:cellulose biosynthesis protein BcsQ
VFARTGTAARPTRRQWQALQSVFQGVAPESGDGQEGAAVPKRLPAGSLSVFAAGGGAGVSTAVATLGRIFALRHERVILLDGITASVLPFYFGADTGAGGACLIRERIATGDHSIRVVSRRNDAAAAPGAQSGETDESLLYAVDGLAGAADRVLVDAWSGMTAIVRQRILVESNSLILVMPDLRSLVGLRSLLPMFHEQERVSGMNITPHCVINQFDAALPLHQEFRRSLTAQLGERLLPFTLRRSDDVALALAEGATVVDHCPDSGIAEDYLRLADWLTMWQGTARVVMAAGVLR